MATVNYPAILPHPLVSDGYGFRSNQSQAVGLFDVETQSRDETRTVNVGFTFTDLQYKVFHGWFMNVLIHGQKWFNMRLDGEFYECTFGGSQPQYSLNRKIITVTATIKTRPNTGFVNYTNQRVSYPNATNYMPSPFDPEGWYGATVDPDGTITNIALSNPSGESVVGLAEQTGVSVFQLSDSPSQLFSIGETAYASILCKNVAGNSSVQFFFNRLTASDRSVVIRVSTGEVIDGVIAAGMNLKHEPLGDGYYLIQVSMEQEVSDDINFRFYLRGTDGAVTPPIGQKLYVQAAFFGKTGKYQGAISYNAVNYMPSPFDPSGWYGSISDPDGTITNLYLGNPSGQSFVGLAEQTGSNIFQLTSSGQDNFLTGETAWSFILCKNINDDSSIQFFYNGTNLPSRNVVVRISDGAIVDGALAAGMTLQRIDLGDGFFLISIERVLEGDEVVDCRQYLRDSAGAVPSIGSQLYVQAAFFGKADDWPAIITPADPDQFPAAITYEY